MNKKEAIQKLTENASVIFGYKVISLGAVEEIINQLGEPEEATSREVAVWVKKDTERCTGKPVVPEYVAEWIGSQLEGCTLGEVAERMYSDQMNNSWSKLDKSEKWIRLNFTEFARAWLDGYEVEKEKRYRVKLTDKHCLVQGAGGVAMVQRSDCEWGGEQRLFTEAEIKAIDERYWAFAEEVTE